MQTYYVLYQGTISQNGWVRDISITHVTSDAYAAASTRLQQMQSKVNHDKNPPEFRYDTYPSELEPDALLISGIVIGGEIYLTEKITDASENINLSDNNNLPIVMVAARTARNSNIGKIYQSINDAVRGFFDKFWDTLASCEAAPVSRNVTEKQIKESLNEKTPFWIRRAATGEIVLSNSYTVVPPMDPSVYLGSEDDLK